MQHISTPEQWKPVPSHEGIYEASDHGHVRSVDRTVRSSDGRTWTAKGVRLSPRTRTDGRLQVVLSAPDRRPRTVMVHRLVLEAFVGLCPEGMEVCHWDDDPTNNHLSNLRWGTKSDNMQDMLRNGRHLNANKTHCPAGHPYDEENTYRTSSGRDCRLCGLESRRRSYRKGRDTTQADGSWAPNLGGFCEHGHEYTAENTYTYPDGKKRACKVCKRRASTESARRYRAMYPERHREAQRVWRERQRNASQTT